MSIESGLISSSSFFGELDANELAMSYILDHPQSPPQAPLSDNVGSVQQLAASQPGPGSAAAAAPSSEIANADTVTVTVAASNPL
jgi:hypothetical protein